MRSSANRRNEKTTTAQPMMLSRHQQMMMMSISSGGGHNKTETEGESVVIGDDEVNPGTHFMMTEAATLRSQNQDLTSGLAHPLKIGGGNKNTGGEQIHALKSPP